MKLLFDHNTKGCCQEAVAVNEREIIHNILRAELPVGLEDMEDNLRETYYPYENRPETILTERNGEIQMTFQLLDKDLRESELGEAADKIREITVKMFPQCAASPLYLIDDEQIPACWFSMELEWDGKKQKHRKAIMPIDKKMMLMTVTYPEEEGLKWQVILKHFFTTLKKIPETI